MLPVARDVSKVRWCEHLAEDATLAEQFQPQFQRTLVSHVKITGKEPYGGCEVNVVFYPAVADTGVVFVNGDYAHVPVFPSHQQLTPKNLENLLTVRASLPHARAAYSSIMLVDGPMKIVGVEHLLATLYAMGIDNVVVDVSRVTPPRHWLQDFGIQTMAVLPLFPDRELSYINALLSTGVRIIDGAYRKRVSAGYDIHDEDMTLDKYLFINYHEGSGLVIEAKTQYPELGTQEVRVPITPLSYLTELAEARPYAKHLLPWMPRWITEKAASLANLRFGYGHGFSEENLILPNNGWTEQLRYPDEIARHTIVDRLGALALLGVRFDHVGVQTYRSGHQHDLDFLRRHQHEFV